MAETEKKMGAVENPSDGGEKESDRTLGKRPMESKNRQKIITHTQNQFWESVIDAIYLGIDLMNVQTGEQ